MILSPMTLNLLTGLCLALAGFAVALREILLSPNLSTFPCAPKAVRIMMFILAVIFTGLAVRFFGESTHTRWPLAGQAAGAVAVLAGVVALYHVVLLWNIVGQRLPAGIWPRLQRIETRARAVKVSDAR